MNLLEKLSAKFGDKVQKVGSQTEVASASVAKVAAFLKSDLSFDLFLDAFGIDDGKHLFVHYVFFSSSKQVVGEFRSEPLSQENSTVPSLLEVYPAARLYENEVSELFGIRFQNNERQKPLFLPEGWVGFPLRKNYVFPKEFAGIVHGPQKE